MSSSIDVGEKSTKNGAKLAEKQNELDNQIVCILCKYLTTKRFNMEPADGLEPTTC